MRPLLLLVAVFAACAPTRAWVPLDGAPQTDAETVLVWVGRGETERFENGAWVRHPEFDYDFSVEQHRRGDHWDSVKSLRRRSPAYEREEGTWGPRAQTLFFRLGMGTADARGSVPMTLQASIGQGTGTTDREYRRAVLDFTAEVSSLAPFDRYRITQHYDYEAGKLTELVELNQGATPFVRNAEVATLFAQHHFDGPPTRQ